MLLMGIVVNGTVRTYRYLAINTKILNVVLLMKLTFFLGWFLLFMLVLIQNLPNIG